MATTKNGIAHRLFVIMALSLLLLLAACSSNSSTTDPAPDTAQTSPETVTPEPEPSKPLTPVTLVVLDSGNRWPEEDFSKAIADPIKQKYPHIAMQRAVQNLEPALAGGAQIDLWVQWHGPLSGVKELDFFMDVTPLATQFHINLNKFDPSALQTLRQISDNKQELYALPYADALYGLYYNKEIFNKFGVPYPADGLTWDATIELAQRLNRLDGGVQYFGLGTESITRTLYPLSLAYVDARTDQSEVNSNPLYRRGLELFQKIYTSQNRTAPQFTIDHFTNDQFIAMFATTNILLRMRSANMDWDVAQFPSYPESPNVYGMHDMHLFVPNKHSAHRDDVMRALEVIFSDVTIQYVAEVQGKLPPMVDPKYKAMVGQGLPEFKDKNLASMFKSRPAAGVEFSPYFNIGARAITTRLNDLINNQLDINTMLRQADEEINQQIATMKN